MWDSLLHYWMGGEPKIRDNQRHTQAQALTTLSPLSLGLGGLGEGDSGQQGNSPT